MQTLDYRLTNEQPREDDSFGLDMGGRMTVVPAERFKEMAEAIQAAYAVQ